MKNSKRYLKFLIMIIGITSIVGISFAYVYRRVTLYVYADINAAPITFIAHSDNTSSTIQSRCPDEVGVNLEYSEFDLYASGEADKVYYEIDFKIENNTVNESCLKVYLTDEEDMPIVPLSSLEDLEDSEYVENAKVIAYDYFDQALNKTFRLRTWINEYCYVDNASVLEYKISVHSHR